MQSTTFSFLNSVSLERKMDYEVADSDRLSELPDSLILSILSLLELREVVATTLLSKRWMRLWTIVPCLNIDFLHPFFDNKLDKFRNFVCGALALWKGLKIQKFSLTFKIDECFVTSDIVDSWLLFAIEKQVEEFSIKLIQPPPWRPRVYYATPCRLYLCSSIKRLCFDSCELKDDEEVNVQWDQLLSLAVENVETLNRSVLNRVISGAPKLQVMSLRIVEHYFSNLEINSTSLKVARILRYSDHCSPTEPYSAMLRIWAPNLETLEISGVPCMSCWLNVRSLTHAILDFDCPYIWPPDNALMQVFECITHVEKVTLSEWCIQAVDAMKSKGMVVAFPNAKYLKLHGIIMGGSISGVFEMFPRLTMLAMQHDHEDLMSLRLSGALTRGLMLDIPNRHRDEEDPTQGACVRLQPPQGPFSLQHLRRVEVTWQVCGTPLCLLVETILKSAPMLEKVVIRLIMHNFREFIAQYKEEMLLRFGSSVASAEIIIMEHS